MAPFSRPVYSSVALPENQKPITPSQEIRPAQLRMQNSSVAQHKLRSVEDGISVVDAQASSDIAGNPFESPVMVGRLGNERKKLSRLTSKATAPATAAARAAAVSGGVNSQESTCKS